MNCKSTLASKTQSFNPGQRFIPIFALLVIVSFTTLSYADFAFAQTDTDDKIIEQATITMNVVLKDGACDQLEKINAVSSTKCDSNKMDRQFLTITFPPENYRDMYNLITPAMKPSNGTYTDIMDDQLWLAYTEYLGKQNKLAQRGDTISSIQDEPVKAIVILNESECKFVDGLGIKEDNFSCTNGMVVNVPASNLEKLADLDFVTTLKTYVPSRAGSYGLPENIEPIISEQNPIEPTITTEPSTNDYTSYILRFC